VPGSLPPQLGPFVAGAPDCVLCLDYDGSLAPIVDDPAAARILPAARAALTRLVPLLGRVAVVSGRPAAFLAANVGVDGVTYAGIYGLERWVDGVVVPDPAVAEWAPVVAEAAARAEHDLPGLLVERKGSVAVTLHWRTEPERGAAATAWADATAVRLGLRLLPGRMAAELRPPVAVDKGTTVADLARGAAAAAFAGDDAGDLPAFAALRSLVAAGELGHALGIGVASDESPPEVLSQEVVVDGPTGLALLLDAWADSLSARG
jgi:trehalose 6-phosphate phosphatase